jgi:hypothetical protein
MKNITIFKSIVDEKIKEEIKEADWCTDLVQYTTYKCKMDGLISAAYLFCPQIIQVEDYIFIEPFWNCSIEDSIGKIRRLEEQYGENKKTIEMSVNTWSLGDFFIGDISESMDNEKLIQQFGAVMVHFWKMRVKELFPEKEIVVELGDDLMGEMGLCITMYEEI